MLHTVYCTNTRGSFPQGTKMWAVQQVYQSHGRWGEGNPHSGQRALEEMYRTYVHTATLTLNTSYHINVISTPQRRLTLAPLCNHCLYNEWIIVLSLYFVYLRKWRHYLLLPYHSFAKRVPANRQSLPKPLVCLHKQRIPRYLLSFGAFDSFPGACVCHLRIHQQL